MATKNIADIARKAQVSPATVTRVINSSGYVSAQKRALVLKTIDDLGYVPNKFASGLRKNRSGFIGHVLPISSENPFFTRIGAAFDEAAQKAGYHVLTAVTHMDAMHEKIMIENLVSLMVEAIVFTTRTACDVSVINWILSRGIPVVMIERPKQIDNIDVILVDHFNAARIAAEHMLKKGHRDIGFIGREYGSGGAVEYERFSGFAEALGNWNVEARKECVRCMPDYSVEFGRQAMTEILTNKKLPSALLITSDVMACGVLQILYERGLKVPDDISIIGFDNTLSALSAPPLTSMELQPDQIGATAVDMILERKIGGRAGAKTVTLSPILIDRGSVRMMG